MNVDRIKFILEEVKSGRIDINEAMASLRILPYEDLGYAKIDHHRQLRTAYPGKTIKVCSNHRFSFVPYFVYVNE